MYHKRFKGFLFLTSCGSSLGQCSILLPPSSSCENRSVISEASPCTWLTSSTLKMNSWTRVWMFTAVLQTVLSFCHWSKKSNFIKLLQYFNNCTMAPLDLGVKWKLHSYEHHWGEIFDVPSIISQQQNVYYLKEKSLILSPSTLIASYCKKKKYQRVITGIASFSHCPIDGHPLVWVCVASFFFECVYLCVSVWSPGMTSKGLVRMRQLLMIIRSTSFSHREA